MQTLSSKFSFSCGGGGVGGGGGGLVVVEGNAVQTKIQEHTRVNKCVSL